MNTNFNASQISEPERYLLSGRETDEEGDCITLVVQRHQGRRTSMLWGPYASARGLHGIKISNWQVGEESNPAWVAEAAKECGLIPQ